MSDVDKDEPSMIDDDDDRESECPTCHGNGTVNPLTAPAGFFCVGVTDCPTCDGTGEI